MGALMVRGIARRSGGPGQQPRHQRRGDLDIEGGFAETGGAALTTGAGWDQQRPTRNDDPRVRACRRTGHGAAKAARHAVAQATD
ncbi:hypothetical protein Ais01nite_37890 [Asanoa ishikariensis]|uniref:hypothetical protein n=1 Tax=Asanoa ishikariensis TaxID=137265 RepID=UPI000B81059E|nr:hypothetical protein [Asanoa ishikariensis]GIF65754.1 hypothetical protein Ais01nite_37890 [Asanoa ishikariensis]